MDPSLPSSPYSLRVLNLKYWSCYINSHSLLSYMLQFTFKDQPWTSITNHILFNMAVVNVVIDFQFNSIALDLDLSLFHYV